MINYQYAELFLENKVQKNFIITDGVVSIAGGSFVYNNYTYLLTNDDLKSVPKIHEMLCDDNNLDFGSCHSNYIEFSIAANVIPLIGKNCRVYIWMNNNVNTLFRIGKYKIKSDKATADRNYRNIVAYDKLDEMLNADVTDWYDSLFPSDSSIISVRAMRQSFCQHFSIDDETDTSDMVNDLVTCGKTIHPSNGSYISGETVLRAICSANGGFGNIDRDGNFRCIVLPIGIVGLYPRIDLYPDSDLYPRKDISSMIGQGTYIPPLPYEDYYTSEISRIQIREDDDDQGVMVGQEGNDYILEGNFIFFGKAAAELETIATRLLGRIGKISYMPYGPVHAFGNPTYEVGDPVRFRTGDVKIHSYILKRTITGTIALDDEYEAVGDQFRDDKSSNISSSIEKLKTKTAKIVSNVDELSVDLEDLDTRESSHFSQTSGAITAEVTRATGAESGLSTRITANAEGLSSEVTRATGAESSMSSLISQNAANILLKVGYGEVSSSISVESGQVTFNSNRLVVNSTSFKLDGNGNAEFSGTIKGASIQSGFDIMAKDSGNTFFSRMVAGVFSTGRLSGSNPDSDNMAYLDYYSLNIKNYGVGEISLDSSYPSLTVYDYSNNITTVSASGVTSPALQANGSLTVYGDVTFVSSNAPTINGYDILTTDSTINFSDITGSLPTSRLSGSIDASSITGEINSGSDVYFGKTIFASGTSGDYILRLRTITINGTAYVLYAYTS